MKYVFFVVTSGSICDRVLSLIEEKKDKGKITIVATTEQLEMFFNKYTDFEVIRTNVHPDLITRKTKHKILINIISSKLEFRKLFKDIEKSEIYFCNKGCAVVTYSYIKKLSKRNKVFFFGDKIKTTTSAYPIEKGFRAFAMRWITKWLMGIETVVYNRVGVPFWELDEKFFENIKLIKPPLKDKRIIDKYAKKLDILKGKKILLAINDVVTVGFVEKTEFINKINNMMGILDDLAPGEYIIKPHHRLNKLYGKMSKCKEIIPPYIPLEFILNHNWKNVIGLGSGSLSSSAIYTDAEVISLIDAFEYQDENVKKELRDRLKKNSQNKIKFLSKIEDLRKILK